MSIVLNVELDRLLDRLLEGDDAGAVGSAAPFSTRFPSGLTHIARTGETSPVTIDAFP